MGHLRYLSVCSGIEAVTCAWHPLGFQPVAFAEIDPFPAAVLAHHYPTVPNWGDMTKFKDWPDATFDVLVGGTPCQSFSVAGLRKGLADPRGNLALTYLAIADRYRPEWLVWENVLGVLSADDGQALGAFLGGLAELGYGFAYRVLDAQYFGLAQRRKRVFVVGHLGDWRRAAAVLFERESLSGHPAPRRETGQGITYPTAPSLTASGRGTERAGESRGQDPVIAVSRERERELPAISLCLNAGGMGRIDAESETLIPIGGAFDTCPTLRAGAPGHGVGEAGDPAFTVSERGQAVAMPFTLAIRGRGDSHDLEYRQDGTANAILTPNGGRGGIGVGAIAFSAKDHGGDAGDLAPTLRAGTHDKSHANGGVMPAVAFTNQWGDESEVFSTLKSDCNGALPMVQSAMQVRRLTPRECERLQGFQDDYTRIPGRLYKRRHITKTRPVDRWEKVEGGWLLMAAEGPRYKALGNSMAVPVMRWIGRRIQLVNDL